MSNGPGETDARVLALLRASLAVWKIDAALATEPDGRWRLSLATGGHVHVSRAPEGIPFRWMVTTPAGRERPASSVTSALDAGSRLADRTGADRPADGSGNDRHSMIPVTILTGFLGSGKTTLLARLLRTPAFARTAVIINEFGEVGIDHDLVAAAEESFVRLETGCICCMVRGDLEATLADLVARRISGLLPAFERIVIETSGLADPAPVLNAVMAETGRGAGILLDSVVTTVDAVTAARTLAREPQSVRQVAVADRLILTKTDLLPGPDEALLARIRKLNPGAPLLIAINGVINPAQLLGSEGELDDVASSWSGAAQTALGMIPPPLTPPGKGEGDVARLRPTQAGTGRTTRPVPQNMPTMDAPLPHDPDIGCVIVRREQPLPALALTLFLEALADHAGADLLRLKGIIHVAEHPTQPAAIHGVQHIFHEPQWLPGWPSEDHSSRIVLIGRGLSQLWVEQLLDALAAEVIEVGQAELG